MLNFVSLVRMLREELQLLQEPGSYVGEVVKVMGKKKVLVKVFIESFCQYFKMYNAQYLDKYSNTDSP